MPQSNRRKPERQQPTTVMTINGSPGNCFITSQLKLTQISPTNSPYLAGKTSSFHGNGTEQEKEKNRWRGGERETKERVDVSGVETGELTGTGKQDTCPLFRLSHWEAT